LYCEGANNDDETIARHKGQLQGYDDDMAHGTIKYFYAVDCKDDGNKCIFYLVLQEVMTKMVDCNEEAQDCAKQQPTKHSLLHGKVASNYPKGTKHP
jgi:hypothetical protein